MCKCQTHQAAFSAPVGGSERAASAGDQESRTGEAAPTIIDIARGKGADTIVVGRRGAGRVAGLLLGSVLQKLVSLSPLPVIVVP